MIHKFVSAVTHPVGEREVRIIASTGDIDRMGEVVVQSGIRFAESVPLLWQHDPAQVLGRAVDLINSVSLRALAAFAPEGLSAKADEICGLVKAGVIDTLSIGFDPIEMEPMDSLYPRGPQRYLKSELLEISFVSIPANPAAVVVERSHGATALRAKIAAMHHRWKVLAAAGRRLSYDERREEVRQLVRAHNSARVRAPAPTRAPTFAERQADLRRLAPKRPIYDGDDARWAYEMRRYLEGRGR